LDNVGVGAEDSPSFTVPILAIDSGLFFEKNTNWFGSAALQTLEPRLFYVYAPDEDQDDVPIFDSSEVSLNNFSNIFRANRFYGEDRVGDTNQVTIGLTSKIIDNETGDQRLVASLGQLYLLDDLEVRLNRNQTPIESGLGDFLAELRTESDGPWTTYSFLQYDHEDSDKTNFPSRPGLNFTRRSVEQLNVTANWPISDRWQFFGRESYSLEDSMSIETTAGVEYNGCCWKIRFTGSSRINSRLRRNVTAANRDDRSTAYFIEFELTSLGTKGLRAGF